MININISQAIKEMNVFMKTRNRGLLNHKNPIRLRKSFQTCEENIFYPIKSFLTVESSFGQETAPVFLQLSRQRSIFFSSSPHYLISITDHVIFDRLINRLKRHQAFIDIENDEEFSCLKTFLASSAFLEKSSLN